MRYNVKTKAVLKILLKWYPSMTVKQFNQLRLRGRLHGL